MFDPMADLQNDVRNSSMEEGASPSSSYSHGGGRGFAQDIHSVTIHARQRTFYIDLKQSSNGKFFKISEKSRGGQKTTIMFDAEDLDKLIEALQEMKQHA